VPTIFCQIISFNKLFFAISSYTKTFYIIMKKPNKIREARLNKKRSRKNILRKEKVRLKRIEEANTPAPEQQ